MNNSPSEIVAKTTNGTALMEDIKIIKKSHLFGQLPLNAKNLLKNTKNDFCEN